ncbi:glycosyltransferase family 2 protein [Aliarcobacter skirrowii]|uniref:glycosyltransferase family 2 protein n=1 Tax=Aliarcobacter skirrowii TaxID=28200 RepID=UPI00082B6C37|nr:glycosyltransferase family 2 protein [Aliarcobacter skirrowii]
MKLSIVTTLYKSSPYIDEFYARISKEAQNITDDYEIIFVDDGSPDDSLQKAVALYEKDNKVKVIELSRNFGHHKAIMTGLSHAKGEFVFLIDSDLEEEPELLGKFWEELHKEKELDVVYGVQESRKGGWFEKWSGEMFYKVFNYFSGVKIPKNFLTVRLMKQNYVKNLTSFQEKEIVFSILTVLTGFKSKSLSVKKLDHSPTTYSIFTKIKLLFNVITASSARPLWLAFNLGLIITSVSLFYIFYLIYRKVVHSVSLDGWTSVMVSISFFGGLIIFFLGIIGIYLAKIFTEVKNRPFTIIKKIHKVGD